MKILVLTPIYEVTTGKSMATPIVHYYAREWVKQGHQVKVFCIEPKYPSIFYWLGRTFQRQLNSILGFAVPIEEPKDEIFSAEDVEVHRITVRKLKPHSLYMSKKVKATICREIESYIPDMIIAHWANPCLEIISFLKTKYSIPTSLVFHSTCAEANSLYKGQLPEKVKCLDYIGFRSRAMKHDFESVLGPIKNSFYSFSGVSPVFLNEYKERISWKKINRFIFSGALINRKYPEVVYQSVVEAIPDGDFLITYIGEGDQRSVILNEWENRGKIGRIDFIGRISREQIHNYLRRSDVFVMVSKNEVFGLVYLEAMALGCITIGSRDEGIDGIIVDGENGFLCEAGNQRELSEIIKKIISMPEDEIRKISVNARRTAEQYSDSNVANNYLKNFREFNL